MEIIRANSLQYLGAGFHGYGVRKLTFNKTSTYDRTIS